MGDITEMMLEGILCEQCGAYIGESVGYPRNCGCENEENSIEYCCECSHFPAYAKKGICKLTGKKVERTTPICEKAE